MDRSELIKDAFESWRLNAAVIISSYKGGMLVMSPGGSALIVEEENVEDLSGSMSEELFTELMNGSDTFSIFKNINGLVQAEVDDGSSITVSEPMSPGDFYRLSDDKEWRFEAAAVLSALGFKAKDIGISEEEFLSSLNYVK